MRTVVGHPNIVVSKMTHFVFSPMGPDVDLLRFDSAGY